MRRRAATIRLLTPLVLIAGVSVAPSVQATASAESAVTSQAFTGVLPTRIADTRTGSGASTPAAHATARVRVVGRGGVPASNVSAVTVTITAVSPAAGGYLTAYPGTATRPATSTVNFAPGVTTANQAVVPVGTDGTIGIYNGSSRPTAVLVDIVGYYRADPASTPGDVVSVDPVRLLDTRSGTGAKTPSGGADRTLAVAGSAGVPHSGASAVVLNVTAVSPRAAGYVTVWPSGAARPATSNLNFGAGQTVADQAVVPLGADGAISFHNGSTGSTPLLADVIGYIVAGGAGTAGSYTATGPSRLLDTRQRGGVAARGSVRVSLSQILGLTSQDVAAVQATVTVVGPEQGGYATIYGEVNPRPGTSTVSFAPGRTVATAAVVSSGDGELEVYNGSSGRVDVLVDVSGYVLGHPVAATGPRVAGSPRRTAPASATCKPRTALPQRAHRDRRHDRRQRPVHADRRAGVDEGIHGLLPHRERQRGASEFGYDGQCYRNRTWDGNIKRRRPAPPRSP